MIEFVSQTLVGMETKKDSFLVIIATVATRKIILQNLNLIGSNHHCKKWVDRITVGWDEMSQPQKCNFFKKKSESSKHNNLTFHGNLPQFINFFNLFSTLMFFLHCMRKTLRQMKKLLYIWWIDYSITGRINWCDSKYNFKSIFFL